MKILDKTNNLTYLNGLHIGVTEITLPSSATSEFLYYANLIDGYTSSMKYNVIPIKALSQSSGYSLPTEIESSGGAPVIVAQATSERFRILIGSDATNYCNTVVTFYYGWFD